LYYGRQNVLGELININENYIGMAVANLGIITIN
jgi:hypothetical protein